MSKKGQHNEALGYALFASTICGILGYVLLLLVVEPLADIVLRIGPVEMFAVAIWGMLLLGSLGSKYVTRGLLAGGVRRAARHGRHEHRRLHPRHDGPAGPARRHLADARP